MNRKPYGNDPLEFKARTQYSFEKVAKAMRNLSRVRKYRAAAKKIQRLCELQLGRPADEREAKELLALINGIEPQLDRWIQDIVANDNEVTPL